jgi:hypothetical protein
MKTFIDRLVIATILSITLVTVISISSYISCKTLPYRTAAVTQTQPGTEILNGSYSNMMNTLYATSGR